VKCICDDAKCVLTGQVEFCFRWDLGLQVLVRCSTDWTVRNDVCNNLVASLSTSCNNAVILSSCYKVVTHNLLTNCWINCWTIPSCSIPSCWNNL
jgi:hypothetical protein